MFSSEIAVWGGLLLLVLLGAAGTVLWLVDGRMLNKLFTLRVHRPQLPTKLLLVSVAAAVVGSLALAGCLMLSFPCRAFWPLLVLMLVLLLLVVPRGMETYVRCLKHTEAHRRYLLGSGATHVESVVPSARRALRASLLPLLWSRQSVVPLAMLMLLCGLVVCGTNVFTAALVTLMTWAAALAGGVLATLLALTMADRLLFDKHENLVNPLP